MFHSGVGHEAVATRDLVTDPVNSLQSGKTADILRFAAESADLLSDFRTASAASRPAASPPTLLGILLSLRLLRIARVPRKAD